MSKPSTRRASVGLGAFALTLLAVSGPTQATPYRSALDRADLLAQLRGNAGGQLTETQRIDDAYATVHSLGRAPLMADGGSGTPVARAQYFLSIYGGLHGVRDPLNELTTRRVSVDQVGNRHVHLDQVYRGLPVFGARLVVHMNDSGVIGSNGVFINDLDGMSITPKLSVSTLRQYAVTAAQKLHPRAKLSVESSRLMIYRGGLLKGVPGRNFLAYEVMVKGAPGQAIRERMILDADSGALLNRISEIHSAMNREIYTPGMVIADPAGGGETVPVPPVITEGSANAPADVPLTGDVESDPTSRAPRPPVDNLYIFAGGTYTLYKNLFGREGYDDGTLPAEEQVQRSVYLINDQCPNAYWDGNSTNYCPGFDADDIVSHEWSHAYTEYTHGLVYQYQSGALNEAYSDIFGETYDLVNGLEGPAGATLTEGDYFENGGSRWLVGEDLSEAVAPILLRDMWDPDSIQLHVPILGIPAGSVSPSPGSVITSENYYCGTGDSGGVHTNSGVANHAYAMLVDGKEFNGQKIAKIGMTKAARIYFQAATHHQTPTTNFAQHADALEQSCQELIGVPLNDVLGNKSTETISAADCAAVHVATLAVEFRGTKDKTVIQKCNYQPAIAAEAEAPALCPSGFAPKAVLREDWENGLPSTWPQGKNVTGDTEAPGFSFAISDKLPSGHSGHAVFAADDKGGSCKIGGDHSGSHWMNTPEIQLDADASYLAFSHLMQAEIGYDGGNLKYSLNGGEFAVVPSDAFVYGAHSGVFAAGPVAPGVPDPSGEIGGSNTNPLAGEAAWTGADQGEATGSWGKTIVDIAKLGAKAGDKVVFRWDWGNDGCGGNLGWFVDDTQVYSCAVDSTGGTTGGTTTGGTTTGGTTTGGATTGGTTTGGGTTGGGTTGGGTTGGGTTGGGSTGNGTTTAGDGDSASRGNGGGGAFGLMLLGVLAGFGLLRRRLH